MKLTEKLGQGMTAEIFAIDEKRVLKLFFENIPRDWVDYEFHLAQQVGEVFPWAPRAYELKDVETRSGILYERAFGKELSQILQEDPGRLEEFGRAMGILQSEMHQLKAPSLPCQKERCRREIESSRELLGPRTDALLQQLEQMDDGEVICHGDFHMGNIMLHEGNYKIIDWMNACKGNPLADVNRTLLMLETPYSMEVVSLELKPVVMGMLSRIKECYLAAYMEKTGVTPQELAPWKPLVAAARIKENVPGEQDWLLNMI